MLALIKEYIAYLKEIKSYRKCRELQRRLEIRFNLPKTEYKQVTNYPHNDGKPIDIFTFYKIREEAKNWIEAAKKAKTKGYVLKYEHLVTDDMKKEIVSKRSHKFI